MAKRQAVEARSAENPNVAVSAADFLAHFGLGGTLSSADVVVNIETALSVPAVWAAVNFIAGTLAGLPLHVYERTEGGGRQRVSGGIATILHDAVSDEQSSFDWRKGKFEAALTGGRAFTFIERNASGEVLNLWLLDPTKTTVKRSGRARTYHYKENNREVVYQARDVIDLAFMMKPDGLGHRGPIATNAEAIGLAIAATRYGSKFFAGGGVPPFAVTGQFQSGTAMKRAADDLQAAVKTAASERRQALVLPAGLDIKAIGSDPDKGQLVELKRFSIEEIARIYSIPPTFLQDLTHGTHSNTEQQDLHFVKHTIKRWAEQFEQELNLKLFGRGNRARYVELNLDGLLRGDFLTRIEGYARAINTAILTPNEVRARENLPDDDNGGKLLIQGATVPLGTSPAALPAPVQPTSNATGGDNEP